MPKKVSYILCFFLIFSSEVFTQNIDEYVATSSGKVKGYLNSFPLIFVAAKPKSILKMVANKILPKPGHGPSKNDRENGYYNLKFYIKTNDNKEIIARVIGDMDPGYGSTSKMLAESAVCLAKDDLKERYGILTPSTAMGELLLNRLQENAGLSFKFE